jgi:putative ABC transport system permease protein
MRPLFVLGWAARDLRQRWLQVLAIAVVIAIGTGVYSALGSTGVWRRESNDASFARLAMYDLRVRAAEGATSPRGEMLKVLATLPDPAVVAVAEERLVLPTQVDASHDGETILVPGRIVGVDVATGGPHVNSLFVTADRGRTLAATDDGLPVGVLERHFADFYDLPSAGSLQLAGGRSVDYVGTALAPEYFFVMTEEGGLFAEANFAVVFMPLESAGELAGQPGRVNDLVITLRPGADPVAVAGQLTEAFDSSSLQLGVEVMQRQDEDAYRILYDDIKGDERFWTVFSALILAGAAFAAFNLSSRLVEAQRREIGIGMALGARPATLAARPLLVGLQVALAGVVAGFLMGLAVVAILRPVYRDLLPLPVWHTGFQPRMFLQAAALGVVVPVVATAWPVWRAVRVMPVEAISTTHRRARRGLAPLLRRLSWPRSALRRMPLGNVLREPRRTLLTILGIGASISTLVAILGMLDSFVSKMSRNETEVLQDHPDRVVVALDDFVAVDGALVKGITDAASVGAVEPVIKVGATVLVGDREVEVLLEALDLDNDLWAPTLVEVAPAPDSGGIVLAAKAAKDLGVSPGDEVVLRHPVPSGAGFVLAETPVRVAAIHAGPFRFNAYVDTAELAALGVPAFANELFVDPAPGVSADAVTRELFFVDGVASVVPVARGAQLFQDTFDDYTAVFRVLELFVLLLALLIAYNAASINADERARERATLFAFGLPLRRAIVLEVAEGILIGVAATVVGTVVGRVIVRWFATSIATTTVPDIELDVVVSSGTIGTAAVLGIVAVAAAPLLTVRRLRRMNIPGTLRIVE